VRVGHLFLIPLRLAPHFLHLLLDARYQRQVVDGDVIVVAFHLAESLLVAVNQLSDLMVFPLFHLRHFHAMTDLGDFHVLLQAALVQVGHFLDFVLELFALEAEDLAVLHLDLLDLQLVEFVLLAANFLQLALVVEQLALLDRVILLSQLQLRHHLSSHLANLRLVLVLQMLHLLHDVLGVEIRHLLRHLHLALLRSNRPLRVLILLSRDFPERSQLVALDLEKVSLLTFAFQLVAEFYAKRLELLAAHSSRVDSIDDS
jgi:hypothetical protein